MSNEIQNLDPFFFWIRHFPNAIIESPGGRIGSVKSLSPLQCPLCEFCTGYKRNIRRHLTNFHNMAMSEAWQVTLVDVPNEAEEKIYELSD